MSNFERGFTFHILESMTLLFFQLSLESCDAFYILSLLIYFYAKILWEFFFLNK